MVNTKNLLIPLHLLRRASSHKVCVVISQFFGIVPFVLPYTDTKSLYRSVKGRNSNVDSLEARCLNDPDPYNEKWLHTKWSDIRHAIVEERNYLAKTNHNNGYFPCFIIGDTDYKLYQVLTSSKPKAKVLPKSRWINVSDRIEKSADRAKAGEMANLIESVKSADSNLSASRIMERYTAGPDELYLERTGYPEDDGPSSVISIGRELGTWLAGSLKHAASELSLNTFNYHVNAKLSVQRAPKIRRRINKLAYQISHVKSNRFYAYDPKHDFLRLATNSEIAQVAKSNFQYYQK